MQLLLFLILQQLSKKTEMLYYNIKDPFGPNSLSA